MSSEFTQWTNWKSDQVGSMMSTVGDIKHWKLVYFDNPTITGYVVHCSHTRCMSCMLYCCMRGLPNCIATPGPSLNMLNEWFIFQSVVYVTKIEKKRKKALLIIFIYPILFPLITHSACRLHSVVSCRTHWKPQLPKSKPHWLCACIE